MLRKGQLTHKQQHARSAAMPCGAAKCPPGNTQSAAEHDAFSSCAPPNLKVQLGVAVQLITPRVPSPALSKKVWTAAGGCKRRFGMHAAVRERLCLELMYCAGAPRLAPRPQRATGYGRGRLAGRLQHGALLHGGASPREREGELRTVRQRGGQSCHTKAALDPASGTRGGGRSAHARALPREVSPPGSPGGGVGSQPLVQLGLTVAQSTTSSPSAGGLVGVVQPASSTLSSAAGIAAVKNRLHAHEPSRPVKLVPQRPYRLAWSSVMPSSELSTTLQSS